MARKTLDFILFRKSDATKKAYFVQLKKLALFLELEPQSDSFFDACIALTNEQAEEFFMTLRGKGQTLNYALTILGNYFEQLVKHNVRQNNPFSTVQRVPPDPVKQAPMIDAAVVEKMVELPARDTKGDKERALIAMLFFTGLRVSEILSLEVSAIDLSAGSVTCERTKNRKSKSVPIPDAALRHLTRQKEGGSKFVFETTHGQMSYKTAYRIFRRIAEDAEAACGATPHSARATAITTLLDAGHSLRAVQRFSGHSSIKMVERYDRRREEQIFIAPNYRYD